MHAERNDSPSQFLFPLACELGTDCWIARYTDRKEGEGKADYQCGRRTQHDHRGTDFAITDYGQMAKGVPVLAVLDGTVFRLRKGVKDMPVTRENRDAISKIGCGNAVILRHAGGYQTAYCHLKEGSVTLDVGDTVNQGEQIGSVGLSGLTEYPHLHFDVRKDGKRIDPFDGQNVNIGCNSNKNGSENMGLWANHLPYSALDLMPPVFSSEPLNRQSRWNAPLEALETSAPVLVLTGRAWNILKGDRWQFKITRPDGTVATDRTITAKENRQSDWYANRLFRPGGGFLPGKWTGTVTLVRRGTDGNEIRLSKDTSILVE